MRKKIMSNFYLVKDTVIEKLWNVLRKNMIRVFQSEMCLKLLKVLFTDRHLKNTAKSTSGYIPHVFTDSQYPSRKDMHEG